MDEDPEPMFLHQVRRIARAPDGSNSFVFPYAGVPVTVVYRTGTWSNVTLSSPYPVAGNVSHRARTAAEKATYRHPAHLPLVARRPLQIALRSETARDRAAKVRGVDREYQTGDEAFDERVYIDAECEDAVLRALLDEAETRSAILALCGYGFHQIAIDNDAGDIAAERWATPEPGFTEADARRMLDAFAKLVTSLPSIETAGVRRGPGIVAMNALASVLVVSGLVAAAMALPVVMPHSGCVTRSTGGAYIVPARWVCFRHIASGIVIGTIAAIATTVVLARVLRKPLSGRSNSTKVIASRAAVGAALTFNAVLLVVSWALR